MEQGIFVELSLKDLFILDHAVKDRLKRDNITSRDLWEETDLLDRINKNIKIMRGSVENGEKEKQE